MRKVSKEDKSSYKTEIIDEVINDENITGKKIEGLTIALGDLDPNTFISHRLGNLQYPCYVYFNLEPSMFHGQKAGFTISDEDKNWGYSLSEELDIYMSRVLTNDSKSYKSLFRTIDDVVVWGFVAFVFITILYYFPYINKNIGNISLLEFFVGLPASIILAIISYGAYEKINPFEKVSRMFLDESVFYWGDQKDIYEKSKKKNANIFWGVLVAFFVSAIAGIITTLMIK